MRFLALTLSLSLFSCFLQAQSLPAVPPSVSTNSATAQSVANAASATRLTGADLVDLSAKAGDSNVQIVLSGTGFTLGMTATAFGGDWLPEVLNDHAASIYVSLPTNYNPNTPEMVSLKGSKGDDAGTRHLETHYIPSGKELSTELQNNKKEAKNLKRYSASTERLASARLQASVAQRQLNLAQNPAANLFSVSSNSSPQPGVTNPYCHADSTAEQAYIRVRRSVMAPKEASDAFGRRLGRHYIVFQVTVENDSTDYQYMLHDVSVDLSRLMNAPAGSYEWAFSTQELSMLRGVPEKGQDYDPRNLTLHILRGVGSVAGGVTGLTATSIQDIFGGAVAGYNGPFLSSFLDIFPDHTATQLNRLSDSAFTSNTLVAKQGAKVFAIFVPETLLLSNSDSHAYWENPLQILSNPTHDFRNADICVDGAFITEVASLGLSKISFADVTQVKPGASVDLVVSGTNLVAGDTLLNAFSQSPSLSVLSASNATWHATVTLPATYNFQLEYPTFLSSSKSGQRSATVNIPAIATPSLISIVFADLSKAQPGTKSVLLKITGSQIAADDTTLTLSGNGITLTSITLTSLSTDGTSAQATMDIPVSYDPTKVIAASLKSKGGAVSNSISLLGMKPTLTKAASSTVGADGTVTVTLTGTGISTGDTKVAFDFGSPSPLKTATSDATSGTVVLTPPSGTWPGTHTATLQTTTRGNSSSVTVTNSVAAVGTQPTLTKAVSSAAAADGTVTITLTGTGITTSDMKVAFDFGTPLPLKIASADGTSGTVTLTPPSGPWPGTHNATLQSVTHGNSSLVTITQ